jgi:hypothetical protein
MKVYIVKSTQNGIDRYSGARFNKNLAVYDSKEKAELFINNSNVVRSIKLSIEEWEIL